jgi:hypothetical protein
VAAEVVGADDGAFGFGLAAVLDVAGVLLVGSAVDVLRFDVVRSDVLDAVVLVADFGLDGCAEGLETVGAEVGWTCCAVAAALG